MTTISDDGPIYAFISEVNRACAIYGRPCGLRELLFCIRDIPYGRPSGARDPLSVLLDWKGTCSGKHLLAIKVLGVFGVSSLLYCQPYQIDDVKDTLARHLTGPYLGHDIWDVHNYLEIGYAGNRVKVDVTWSYKLAAVGFCATQDWDGTSDFLIAAPPGEATAVDDSANLSYVKEALLMKFNTPHARMLRERYIEDLAAFAHLHDTALSRVEGIKNTIQTTFARQPNLG